MGANVSTSRAKTIAGAARRRTAARGGSRGRRGRRRSRAGCSTSARSARGPAGRSARRRCRRSRAARGPRASCACPDRSPPGGSPGERGDAGADHRGGPGAERGDVVGVHDALGEAEDEHLGEEPPAEHEQPSGAGVAANAPEPRGESARRGAGGRRPAVLGARRGALGGIGCGIPGGGVRCGTPKGGVGRGAGALRFDQDGEREREHPEQRERQHPSALVAETGLEQAQRPGGDAEGGGVGVVAVGEDRVGDVLGRGGAFGAEDGAGALRKRGDRAEVHEDLTGPPDLPFDAPEAVVAEGEVHLGVVGGPPHEGALGGGGRVRRGRSMRGRPRRAPPRRRAAGACDARSTRAHRGSRRVRYPGTR